jgi:HrpA-like RNA helicase
MHFRGIRERGEVNKKKLVLLSATLDVPKFVNYYSGVSNVSHMKISGRSNPIYSIFLDNDEDRRLMKSMIKLYMKKIEDILDALLDDRYIEEHLRKCEEGKKGIIDYKCDLELLGSTGIKDSRTGDILIFLPIQRMINDMYTLYRKKEGYKDVFFTKLSRGTPMNMRSYITGDPKDTYLKDHYTRRVIFSSTISQTGITIVGIKFIIETGITNRVTYSDIMYPPKRKPRSRQKISYIDHVEQADAIQRCGRAGRKAPGICIHLYSLDTYNNKLRSFKIPEIYDAPLHEVVLNFIYFTVTLDKTITYIENLPDTVGKRELDCGS